MALLMASTTAIKRDASAMSAAPIARRSAPPILTMAGDLAGNDRTIRAGEDALAWADERCRRTAA